MTNSTPLMQSIPACMLSYLFFFNDTATTEIYTLSLHDALPICRGCGRGAQDQGVGCAPQHGLLGRSEEHTSELQSPCNLVCRLLLEKKKYHERVIVIAEYNNRIRGHARLLLRCHAHDDRIPEFP